MKIPTTFQFGLIGILLPFFGEAAITRDSDLSFYESQAKELLALYYAGNGNNRDLIDLHQLSKSNLAYSKIKLKPGEISDDISLASSENEIDEMRRSPIVEIGIGKVPYMDAIRTSAKTMIRSLSSRDSLAHLFDWELVPRSLKNAEIRKIKNHLINEEVALKTLAEALLGLGNSKTVEGSSFFNPSNVENDDKFDLKLRELRFELESKAIKILDLAAKYSEEIRSQKFLKKIVNNREFSGVIQDHILDLGAKREPWQPSPLFECVDVEDLVSGRRFVRYPGIKRPTDYYNHLLKELDESILNHIYNTMLSNGFKGSLHWEKDLILSETLTNFPLLQDPESIENLKHTLDEQNLKTGRSLIEYFESKAPSGGPSVDSAKSEIWYLCYLTLEYLINDPNSVFKTNFQSEIKKSSLIEKLKVVKEFQKLLRDFENYRNSRGISLSDHALFLKSKNNNNNNINNESNLILRLKDERVENFFKDQWSGSEDMIEKILDYPNLKFNIFDEGSRALKLMRKNFNGWRWKSSNRFQSNVSQEKVFKFFDSQKGIEK